MGLFQLFSTEVVKLYSYFLSSLPPLARSFFEIFFIVLFISLFAIFIWKFYQFVATKNIIELNLNQYNTYEYPLLAKVAAAFFYILEYLLILPFLIFFWFVIFSVFLLLLTENANIEKLITLSAVIIATIRMVSYYSEDLSKDVAKLLPFTLLGVFLLDSLIKDTLFSFETILVQISTIPAFLDKILFFFGFIIVLEIILRLLDFIISIFDGS